MHFGKVFLGGHYVESNTLTTTTKSMTKREVDQWATHGRFTLLPFRLFYDLIII